ncbi:MAG TPA: TRAP transporter large permease subunit [Opitutaceae bacterium]|nr:TRAP transporter large permease subunit [Opitutaceae bacterium]
MNIEPFESPAPARAGWQRALRGGENALVVVPLALSVVLPLLEVVLRRLHTGIVGSIVFVQNFTLIIGMAGAAIAAREGRLLSFATVSSFLKGGMKAAARIVSSGVAAAVSGILCAASLEFMLSERQAGGRLVGVIPDWAVELVLPLGFGLIALRLVWHAPGRWRGRLLTLLLAAAIVLVGVFSPVAPEKCVVPGLAALLVATILGAPVFTAIGGAALILFWGDGSPIATIPLKHHSLVTSSSLPTIPLFTLAGYFLAESGASQRLIRVFQALLGSFRGGPAIVTALLCAFFTSFTGASGVTILALGGLLMPVLRSARYSERDALGLLTGAGSLGLLFPPCLPVILYSIIASTTVANLNVANVSANSVTMERMFLGGLVPGVLMVVLTAWWGIRRQPREAVEHRPFAAAEAGRALWAAKWELLLPVVALAALFSGFATPIEAAAVTAAYALLITTVIHRDLRPLKDLPRVMTECGLLVGGVLLILGVALGFTHYLVLAQVPDQLAEWSIHAITSKWLFLLGLNAVLLVVGGLIEIYAAIVVVVPLLVPIGIAFGIDPVHLGIIFLANMELGFLAPPVGLNLLLSSYRFNKPVVEVMRAALPMLLVLLIGVLLITYVPPLTTFLPNLFR